MAHTNPVEPTFQLTVTTNRCHQAMSQVAQMRITSTPRDDGPSDEDVVVINIDYTSLRLAMIIRF